MFRKLFKRQPLPMPTTRDSLFRIAGLLGCSDYGISDDELRIVTKPLGDESDILGSIEVKFTIGPPNLTSVAEPRMARAKYTYTTKSAGVQQELTIWDVTYYPLSATTKEGDENAAIGVYGELRRIIHEHELN